jgi:DegV family protein with EDD domain
MTVKIVTDSVADIPAEIVKELDITVIPIHVCFGQEVYRDGVDITTEEFYKKLKNSRVMPTTAVPSPGTFAMTFDELAEKTDEIMVITLNSKLSGLYNAAKNSIELMEKKCRVEVIDSRWVIMAQGFIVISAARAALAGAGIEEIRELVNRNITRVQLCSAFDTLEYLKRGGRIGKAAAFLGSMFHIHPIIGLDDGEVVPISKARSMVEAMDYLYNFAAKYSYIEELSVACFSATESADYLIGRLGKKFPVDRIVRSGTSPVIGTHTGPNLIALAIMGDL